MLPVVSMLSCVDAIFDNFCVNIFLEKHLYFLAPPPEGQNVREDMYSINNTCMAGFRGEGPTPFRSYWHGSEMSIGTDIISTERSVGYRRHNFPEGGDVDGGLVIRPAQRRVVSHDDVSLCTVHTAVECRIFADIRHQTSHTEM